MHTNVRVASLSNCRVFFDFDNTITPFDVLDAIIERFSVDKGWMKYEKDWKDGKIGSYLCLIGQLRSVEATKEEVLKYAAKIKIDPYFHKIFLMLKREGIKPIILSDSFQSIIETVLENNGIKGVKVYANALHFKKNKLVPGFPYRSRRCRRCAHCKKKNLLKKEVKDKIIMYVGDGLSDVCPAENSDIVFAKGRLLEHFRKNKRLCVAFKDIRDVYNYFKGLEK